jgi:ribosome-associated translation inhibitor RaiA
MLAAPTLVVQLPLQITFRGMAPSDAIESVIRERAAKLERFHGRIMRCHVTVDVPHRHHHKGRLYAVRIDLTTPTGEIAVTRNPSDDSAHEDLHAVVRDAFDAVVRQLQDQVRYRRGDVKAHEEPDFGTEAPEPSK